LFCEIKNCATKNDARPAAGVVFVPLHALTQDQSEAKNEEIVLEISNKGEIEEIKVIIDNGLTI